MHPRHRKIATGAAIAIGALGMFVLAAAAFVRAGVYNIAADDPHYPLTYSMLEQLRDASIKTRASKLTPPADLMSEARIRQGSGNYNAMCTGCHLAPGMEPTEISKGLYPAPPNLSKVTIDASQAFWTIKHGIKASGMPAWGGSMGDDYIWNMAAFLQRLPKLDKASYDALVAASGGHSHGGGETGAHHHHHDEGAMGDMPGMPAHDEGDDDHDHDHADGDHAEAPHTHAPGTPAHTDAPPHVDPPGTPPHSHGGLA